MDEDSRILRGERAAQVLGNTEFQVGFKELEAQYIDDWRKADTAEKRETAHARIRALEDVALHLKKKMGDGEMAAHAKAVRTKGVRPV